MTNDSISRLAESFSKLKLNYQFELDFIVILIYNF